MQKKIKKIFFDFEIIGFELMTSILSELKKVFVPTNSNAIISKSKNILWTFFLHFRNLH